MPSHTPTRSQNDEKKTEPPSPKNPLVARKCMKFFNKVNGSRHAAWLKKRKGFRNTCQIFIEHNKKKLISLKQTFQF